MNHGQNDVFAKAQAKYQAGELADAAELFQHVLEHDPVNADALHMLGIIAYQLGQTDAAAALLKQAVTVRQPFAEAETNLGTVLMALGRLDEAQTMLEQASEHAPDNAVIWFNLGNVYYDRGDGAAAEPTYEKAVELDPDHAEAWCQLGLVLRNAEKIGDAMVAYEKAIAAKPDFSQALYNLANVYRDLDRYGDAAETLNKALNIRPDYAMAWNSLGTLLGDMGRPTEAVEAFDQAVLYAPDSAAYASNRLCALQYKPGITDEALAEAHTEWYWLHVATAIELGPTPNVSTDPDRPLKLGFVSPDFGVHPVGFLSAPLFEHMNGTDMTTVVFSTRPAALDDAVSVRIKAACDAWIDASDLSDSALAERISDEAIDILFDMSGQTSGNRLAVFARKPAPVQISWIGYVGTTGLPAMDYVLSDNRQSPDESDVTYCETALRLPDGYTCYAPPDYAPDVGPLPAADNGCITFGCLNNPGKVNADVIALFASVLMALPDSRLLFRFRGLDDPAVQDRFRETFEAHGIAAERLAFEGRTSHPEFLETYNRVDIALDTIPYSGGLTTAEALWMGVPTLTVPGSTFAGRHASSYLHTAGYEDLVCATADDLVKKAKALCSDFDALNTLRSGMRIQVAASPLCDGKRFARNFAAAMRQAWRDHCAAADPS